MAVAFSTQYAKTYTLARQAARLEQRRQELRMTNAQLRVEIERLQTDDRYIEQLARQQLGLVRPGEIELLIVPPGHGATPGTPDPSRAAPGSGMPEPRLAAPDAAADDEPARTSPWDWAAQMWKGLVRLFGNPSR